MISAVFNYFDRLTGKLVCWQLGSHTPDWTFAHMMNSRPVCVYCKKEL